MQINPLIFVECSDAIEMFVRKFIPLYLEQN